MYIGEHLTGQYGNINNILLQDFMSIYHSILSAGGINIETADDF